VERAAGLEEQFFHTMYSMCAPTVHGVKIRHDFKKYRLIHHTGYVNCMVILIDINSSIPSPSARLSFRNPNLISRGVSICQAVHSAKRAKYGQIGQRAGRSPVIIEITPGAGEEWKVNDAVEMLQKGGVSVIFMDLIGCVMNAFHRYVSQLSSICTGNLMGNNMHGASHGIGRDHPNRHAARHRRRSGKPGCCPQDLCCQSDELKKTLVGAM